MLGKECEDGLEKEGNVVRREKSRWSLGFVHLSTLYAPKISLNSDCNHPIQLHPVVPERSGDLAPNMLHACVLCCSSSRSTAGSSWDSSSVTTCMPRWSVTAITPRQAAMDTLGVCRSLFRETQPTSLLFLNPSSCAPKTGSISVHP